MSTPFRSAFAAFCLCASSVAFAQGTIPSIGGIQPNMGTPPQSAASAADPTGFSKGLLESMKGQLQNVKALKHLPVRGLIMFEMKDGKIFLISEDGRLAIFGGRWVDVWEKKNIASIDDASTLDRINFVKLGVDPEEITSLKVGTGPRQVVVFADPSDPGTKGLADQMKALLVDFTFRVVLVPRKPGAPLELSRRLACAPDKATAGTSFLTGVYTNLPVPADDCKPIPMGKGLATAMALRLNRLPLVVRDDGYTASGPSIALSTTLSSAKH